MWEPLLANGTNTLRRAQRGEAPRPNTSFAPLGYPRSRKNGGHEPESNIRMIQYG
jgi:hypothetical protein